MKGDITDMYIYIYSLDFPCMVMSQFAYGHFMAISWETLRQSGGRLIDQGNWDIYDTWDV